MSIYGNLKEAYKDMYKFAQDKDAVWKMVYMLKTFSFFAVCTIYLLEECELRNACSLDIQFKVPEVISSFLSEYTLRALAIFWVYYVVLSPIIKVIVIEIKVQTAVNMFPLWNTAEDILEITVYGIVLMKLFQDMLLCLERVDVMVGNNIIVYVLISAGAVFRFVKRMYIQNANRWCKMDIKYTQFFDSEGKRIAQDDEIVYRNKIYSLCRVNGTWYLSDNDLSEGIKLEDAVTDKGGLKVYHFNMGKEI